MALAYRKMGKYDEAEPLYFKALHIRELVGVVFEKLLIFKETGCQSSRSG